MLLLVGVLVDYLHRFALTTGLDSTSADYRAHWYSLLFVEIAVVVPLVMMAVRRMARSRCDVCVEARTGGGSVPARHELGHIWSLWGLLLGGTIAANCVPGLIGMHDGAWHSVTLRDTSLSPTHIPVFFGMAPVTVGLIVAVFIYGRTRLPGLWGKA